MKTAAIVGTLAFLPMVGLYFLLVLGYPYGEFAMGGKYKVVPKEKRNLLLLSIVVQLLAIAVILQTARILPLLFSLFITRRICYFFAVYFSLNIIANAFSKSKKERLVMTPIAIVIAICFWMTAIGS